MQIDMFSFMRDKYKINKPIRLIELFAGVGSQATALSKLNVVFEHYKIVEYDKYAIASYNAIHNTNFKTSDITKITAKDLHIVDTDKYEYIMTYSFPCQDLSLAGKRKGMSKDDNTRSGLLWEVERLLDECEYLPQILLMENVPEIIGLGNVEHFNNWQKKLESLGYTNYHELLNAKHYGIPQNRNRCFMISILGDYYYQFPQRQKLKLRLKDMLEDEVDEKYYLSDKMIEGMKNTNISSYKLENKLQDKDGIADTIIARFEGTPQCIKVPEATKKGYAEAHDGDGVYIDRPHQKRGVVQKGMIQTIKTQSDDIGVVVKGQPKLLDFKSSPNFQRDIAQNGIVPTLRTEPHLGVVVKGNYSPSGHNASRIVDTNGLAVEEKLRIRKLTPKECWRLMGFDDEDFEKASKVNSNAQLYKQAGNSIVVNVLEAIFKELF